MLAFPDTTVGSDYSYTIRIANQGPKALAIEVGGIELSMGAGVPAGAFLWGTLPPASLEPGQAADFALRFAPATIGEKSATVTIPTNDVRHPRFTFALKGTAIPARIAVSGLEVPLVGISTVAADYSASLTPDAGYELLRGGVCWGESAYPTTADAKSEDGTSGSFSGRITGLGAGTVYYARAYGVYSEGGAERTVYGPQRSFITLPLAPAAPAVAKVGYPSGSGQLDVSWLAVKGAIDYQLYYYSNNTPPYVDSLPSLKGLTDTSTRIAGLTDHSTYYVWIRARNASGTSAWSPVASNAPGIRVESVAIEQAAVIFLGPDAGYARQLTAVVTPADATDPRVAWSSNNAACTVSDNGLATATGAFGTATITVKTVDQDKTATVSATATVPNKPVLTLGRGTRQLEASWAADPLATGYSLAYGTSTSSLTNTVAPTSNAFTITGLADKTAYHVAVTAINGFGSATGETVSKETLLAAPTGLLVSSGAFADKLNLSWNYVGGSGIAYKVYYSTSPGVDSSCGSWTTNAYGGTDFTVSPGTTYYLAVSASDGQESALSAETSGTARILLANHTWASATGQDSGTIKNLALTSWTTQHGGGYGWARRTSSIYTGDYEMASSYGVSSLEQIIDLVGGLGFSAARLQQPSATFTFQIESQGNVTYQGKLDMELEFLDAAGGTFSSYAARRRDTHTIAVNKQWGPNTVSITNTTGLPIAKVRVRLEASYNGTSVGGYIGPVLCRPRLIVKTP